MTGRGRFASAAWLAVACACGGARTGLSSRAGADASAPEASAVDAAREADAAAADASFACGEIQCTSAGSQYCLVTYAGCLPAGAACTTSADCCSLECLQGVCGPIEADAGTGASYSCEPLPPACLASPTCTCVLDHTACPAASCTVDGGIFVVCPGE